MGTAFDPKNLSFKKPFGAVSCGTEVSFTLRPEAEQGISAAWLDIYEEFGGKRSRILLSPLQEGGFGGVYRAPEQPELIWYQFAAEKAGGTQTLYGPEGWGCSGESRWQLTVYDSCQETPQWFGRGITYQIFPDRFYRTEVPGPTGMVGKRTVHQAWEDTPVYLPDADGKVLNSDFFGGNLAGIASKLDYLQSLSVTTLYLNPIFESASNHRYNTADYLAIDPMLGTEGDFDFLCRETHRRGMRIILDGVFNHNGSNSRYFNAEGFYPGLGAAQSQKSPYYKWYHFSHWPDQYDAWWGIDTLPAVEENDASYREFIIRGKDSVVRRWLRAGADGWRLDVADELPDDFIAELRDAMEEEKPDSILLGEVWEDGSNKIAYSRRRKYLLGNETHGLMNYPFRTAALAWLAGGDAGDFREAMENLREHYPPAAFYSAMNFLGTHDTARILTLLGAEQSPESKSERAAYRLNPEERQRGKERLKLGALLLYVFPGSPTVYYGDEAGMEGFEDPLNRRTYPWGGEDSELLAWYQLLGRLRAEHSCLQDGSIRYLAAEGGLLVLERQDDGGRLICAMNAGDTAREMELAWEGAPLAQDLLTGQQFFAAGGSVRLRLPPRSGVLLE